MYMYPSEIYQTQHKMRSASDNSSGSPQRRRGRHQHLRQPVPTAILLRNAILPPSRDGGHAQVGRNTTRNAAAQLLPPPSSLRLELVADRSAIPEDALQELDETGGKGEEVILYSSALLSPSDPSSSSSYSSSQRPSLHPQWYHLDEKVALLEAARERLDGTCTASNAGVGSSPSWEELYKAMKARIVMDLSEGCTTIADLDGKVEPASNNNNRASAAALVLAELALYPTDLRRLPRPSAGGSMSGDDNRIDEDDEGIFDNDQNSPRTSADAAANIVIPSALPPNALLVHYSDGKTRIDSALYQRLVEAGVVSEVNSKFGRTRLDSGVLEDRKARRFDDESFDMLSGSEAGVGDAREDTSLQQEITRTAADSSIRKDSVQDNVNSSFTDAAFDLLGGESPGHEEPLAAISTTRDIKADQRAAMHTDVPTLSSEITPNRSAQEDDPHPVLDLSTSDQCEIDDLRSEIAELKAMLVDEEHYLEEDKSELANATNGLRSVAEETRHIKLETEMMNEDALQEEHRQSEVLIHLEVRRAKVLRDLRQIYPIQCLPDNVYTIGGLHLPSDLNNPDVPDAVVSTALGYVCHLVYMSSKYLCAPLRYRLFCNSSRSAVQDDGVVAVYPLFRERVVEREQFDRACTLLNRNVEYLLRGRCITIPDSRSHILNKLNRLFEESD